MGSPFESEVGQLSGDMMLKPKTIFNFFIKRKWHGYTTLNNVMRVYWPYDIPVVALSLVIDNTMPPHQLHIKDFRHPEYGNLHIDSYWGWPRTVKELEDIYKGIVDIYSDIGGITSLKSLG